MTGFTGAILVFTAVVSFASLFLSQALGSLTQMSAVLSLAAGILAGAAAWNRLRGAEPIRPVRLNAPVIIFSVIFLLFSLRHFLWYYYVSFGDLFTLNRHSLRPLTHDLSLIQFLASGAPFWPHNPLLSPQLLFEPFGMNLFSAVFFKLGLPLTNLFAVTGLVYSVILIAVLYVWCGWFAVAAFLFSGSVAGYLFFFSGTFQDYQSAYVWKNIFLHLLVPFRSFLFVFPAGIFLLSVWRKEGREGQRTVPSWIQAVIFSSIAFFHLTSFWFLLFVFTFWSVAGKRIRETVSVYLPSVIAGLLLTIVLTDKFSELDTAVSFQPGWFFKDNGILISLLLNFGVWGIVFLYAVYRAFRLRSRALLFDVFPVAAVMMFVFAVRYTRFESTGFELLAWNYLLIIPFVYEFGLSCLKKWISLPLIFLMFVSGAVSMVYSVGKDRGASVVSMDEKDQVCVMLDKLPPSTSLLAAPVAGHPVSLCGHSVFLGQSADPEDYAQKSHFHLVRMDRILNGMFDWKHQVEQTGLKYLFWGPREEKMYPESNLPWMAENRRVTSSGWGDIYALNEPAAFILPPAIPDLKSAGGLRLFYFENAKTDGEPVLSGRSGQLQYVWNDENRPVGYPFSVLLGGEIFIPKTGPVKFFLASDDGSELWLGDRMLINNSGEHAQRVRVGVADLEKGWYPFRIHYFDAGGEAVLRVWWQLAHEKEENIPLEYLRS